QSIYPLRHDPPTTMAKVAPYARNLKETNGAVFALPHQLDRLSRSKVSPELCLPSMKGLVCLVEGESWKLDEELPEVSFRAPRSPNTQMISSIALRPFFPPSSSASFFLLQSTPAVTLYHFVLHPFNHTLKDACRLEISFVMALERRIASVSIAFLLHALFIQSEHGLSYHTLYNSMHPDAQHILLQQPAEAAPLQGLHGVEFELLSALYYHLCPDQDNNGAIAQTPYTRIC
ncbi:MAG: hypothetical protein AAGJ35_12850, partial [Myxococcota bacterium]